MYKTTQIIGVCLLAAGLSACSASRYKPADGSTPEQIFSEACASCHGDKGQGKFGFLLSVAGSETPAEEIVDKIRNGGRVMPAFPGIDENAASAMAGYIKNL